MTITLYTKDDCAPCVTVKKYLARRNIKKYEEKNIKNTDTRDELWRLYRSMTVPTLVINGRAIVGPRIAEIARVLRDL